MEVYCGKACLVKQCSRTRRSHTSQHGEQREQPRKPHRPYPKRTHKHNTTQHNTTQHRVPHPTKKTTQAYPSPTRKGRHIRVDSVRSPPQDRARVACEGCTRRCAILRPMSWVEKDPHAWISPKSRKPWTGDQLTCHHQPIPRSAGGT